MMFLLLLLFVPFTASTAVLDGASPIISKEYQQLIGHGFSTNWFKTADPLSKYHTRNIIDIAKKGFQNVRLRSRADLYETPYNGSARFNMFLSALESVVDDCLDNRIIPIISWIHHEAEANATEEAREAYIEWWRLVADRLRDKNYRLSFNLFTELGVDKCGKNCGDSLRENTTKYNQWTREVVKAIRNSGGRNLKRVLILASPAKTSRGLPEIDPSIYENDSHMMAEWHTYASGPNKKAGSNKHWSGKGSHKDRQFLKDQIQNAKNFELFTYFGAWMPQDNSKGSLDEEEVINFARFFVSELKNAKIPWSLNVLDNYYDTQNNTWLTEPQNMKGQLINMSRVLDNIQAVLNADVETNGCSKMQFLALSLGLIISVLQPGWT